MNHWISLLFHFHNIVLCFLSELTSTGVVLHKELIQSHPASTHSHHYGAAQNSHETQLLRVSKLWRGKESTEMMCEKHWTNCLLLVAIQQEAVQLKKKNKNKQKKQTAWRNHIDSFGTNFIGIKLFKWGKISPVCSLVFFSHNYKDMQTRNTNVYFQLSNTQITQKLIKKSLVFLNVFDYDFFILLLCTRLPIIHTMVW